MSTDQFLSAYFNIVIGVSLMAAVMVLVAINSDRLERWIALLEAEEQERRAESSSCKVWAR